MSFNFKEALKDLDDDISLELSGKFDENGDIPDGLYLGAEFMPEEGIKALYNICYNLVLRRYGQEYNCNFEQQFKVFESTLKEVYDKAEKWELHYSDDGWHYSISSLDLPNKLLQFCNNLDSKFYDNDTPTCYGVNNCLDIKQMVYDSEICYNCTMIKTQYEFVRDKRFNEHFLGIK